MKLSGLLKDFECNQGASRDSVRALETAVGQPLPSDYKEFMLECNGGEGSIGKNYLMLWSVEEVPTFNKEYEVEVYAPGWFCLGQVAVARLMHLILDTASKSSACHSWEWTCNTQNRLHLTL